MLAKAAGEYEKNLYRKKKYGEEETRLWEKGRLKAQERGWCGSFSGPRGLWHSQTAETESTVAEGVGLGTLRASLQPRTLQSREREADVSRRGAEVGLFYSTRRHPKTPGLVEQGQGLGSGLAPSSPRDLQSGIQQRLGHRGRPLGLPLCEPWEKPRATTLAFGLWAGASAKSGWEPTSRKRREGPALKLGAHFWERQKPQLDSQVSGSAPGHVALRLGQAAPLMPSPAPLRLPGLDGVRIEGGRRVAASRSLAVQA